MPGSARSSVDRMLNDAKAQSLYKVLILGAGEQGKSTLYKQLGFLWGEDQFKDPYWLDSYKRTVRRNVSACVQVHFILNP